MGGKDPNFGESSIAIAFWGGKDPILGDPA